MSELPPPLPPSATPPKPSSLAAWLCWIFAAVVMPASPFLLLGKKAMDGPACSLIILLAVAAQFLCSLWVPMVMAKRGKRGPGFVIALAIALMMASVAIGSASFFGACVAAEPHMDFR
jgi:hypothetical protein